MKFSIVIPVHNEEKFIIDVLKRVNEQKKNFDIEIIISNDGSTDQTSNLLEKNKDLYDILVYSEVNYGKGSAIKQGLEKASGDFTLIQDSDLEYNPNDYKKLFEPALKFKADVVYGSRFLGGSYVRLHFFWHFLANKLLTVLSNIFTNLNMTDMETGYKLIKTEAFKKINIQEKAFGIEPEITIKLAIKKYIFYEVPISYEGRSYEEGKKIKLRDAFVAIFCIFKYAIFSK